MSNIKLAGILGKDAELRFLKDGVTPVLEMSVSVYTGGTQEKGYNPSVWVNVSCFDKSIIDNADMYKKGTKVTITGQPRPLRTWTDKEGKEHPAFDVTAYAIELGDTFRDQPDEGGF